MMFGTVRRLARPCLFQTTKASRHFVSATTVLLSDLPYHLVVGLPALSPTMELGTLAEWYIGEGDAFKAGDAIAKIETDKASIDFEAQDDGYVAKLLLEAAEGNDVAVGTPILITVEEEEDVAAFKDYVHKEEEVAATPAPPVEKEATEKEVAAPAAEAPSEPPAVVETAVAATPPPPPTTPLPAAAPEPSMVQAPPLTTVSSTAAWGMLAQKTSPLAKALSAQQQAYVEQYGTTGQKSL